MERRKWCAQACVRGGRRQVAGALRERGERTCPSLSVGVVRGIAAASTSRCLKVRNLLERQLSFMVSFCPSGCQWVLIDVTVVRGASLLIQKSEVPGGPTNGRFGRSVRRVSQGTGSHTTIPAPWPSGSFGSRGRRGRRPACAFAHQPLGGRGIRSLRQALWSPWSERPHFGASRTTGVVHTRS